MNSGFEYIDIILLAMIAGCIFLRLRGILGKRTGFEGKIREEFNKEFTNNVTKKNIDRENFDDAAKKDFINGAKRLTQSEGLSSLFVFISFFIVNKA